MIPPIYKAKEERYDKMQYRFVGRSGLKFPAVSLGFWHNFGSISKYETMKEICRTAFDNGVTHFDLANNYGPYYGAAETNVGHILSEDFRPYRDELVISSKAGYDMWPGPYGVGGSRKYLMASLDQSLKRLGLDYVDIFYHHCMDPDTPLEETMETLVDMVRSGKVLYAGISNYDEANTRAAINYMRSRHCPLIVNQRRYSILDRTIEKDGVKDCCLEEGMGIIVFSPLAQGLLTDRYLNGIPQDSRVMTDPRFLNKSALTENKLNGIRKLNDLARQRGQTLAQMALAWLLQYPVVCSVIAGASRPEQLLDNIKATENISFSAEENELIDRISEEIM